MKVLFNIMTTVSFVGVVSIIGGGYYVYSQRDALIDNVRQQVTEAAIDGVAEALPGMMGGDAAIPEVPSVDAGVPTTLPTPGF